MKTSNRDWDRFLVSLDYLTSLSGNDTRLFLKCLSVNHHIKNKEMIAKTVDEDPAGCQFWI